MNIGHRGKGHRLIALAEDCVDAPHDQHHHHHRRDLHNPQSLLARFMHADNVLAPEIQRDYDSKSRGEVCGRHVSVAQMEVVNRFVDKATQI